MSEERLIKKYPNRRLYDMALSEYITLEKLKQYVMEGIEFKVIEARSEKDVTQSCLIQIILEQEEAGTPLFNTETLATLIKLYNHPMQVHLRNFLQQSIQAFNCNMDQFQSNFENMENLKQSESVDPYKQWTKLAEQNLKTWQAMFNPSNKS